MENKFETNEELRVSTETIDSGVLQELIYQGDRLPKDNRFLTTEKGGVFKYFDVRDLNENKENKFYPVVKISNKIVGLSELEISPSDEKTVWIKFLSIDPEYQEKGYASKLAEEIFRFAKENGFDVEGSSYTEQGYEKLKNLFNRLSEESGVKFLDK